MARTTDRPRTARSHVARVDATSISSASAAIRSSKMPDRSASGTPFDTGCARRIGRAGPVQRSEESAEATPGVLRIAGSAPATGRRDRRPATGRSTSARGTRRSGCPMRTGTGTGSGSRGASNGSHVCSWTSKRAASARRGSLTSRSSPRRHRALSCIRSRAESTSSMSPRSGVLLREERAHQGLVDLDFGRRPTHGREQTDVTCPETVPVRCQPPTGRRAPGVEVPSPRFSVRPGPSCRGKSLRGRAQRRIR